MSSSNRDNSRVGDDNDAHSAAATEPTGSEVLAERVLRSILALRVEAEEYAATFGLLKSDAAFYALFKAIRTERVPLNLRGEPFMIRSCDLAGTMETGPVEVATTAPWIACFTIRDLEQALRDDFLDAARGSTDNRKAWTITDVSQPRGNSFHEARMTYQDVRQAMERGTVIFNAAGAVRDEPKPMANVSHRLPTHELHFCPTTAAVIGVSPFSTYPS
jgi:hypothetical protein